MNNIMYDNRYYLRDYHSGNPIGFNFHSIPSENISNTFFIGSEIEIEPIDDTDENNLVYKDKLLSSLHKLADYNWIHCENDDSLVNGVEIITQPMSLQFIRLYGYNLIKKINSLIHKYNFTGNKRRCGLHFHISRLNFNSATEDILWDIFYRFSNELMFLSGRNNIEHMNHYCRFPISNDHWDQVDRYSALNLFPTDTIEFRFPSGLNRSWEWMGWVEFFIGLIKYVVKLKSIRSIEDIASFTDLINNIPESRSIYVKRLLKRLPM